MTIPHSSTTADVQGQASTTRLAGETTARNPDGAGLAASVFEGLGVGLMVADAGRRVLMINAAFTAISGYGLNEVAGRDLRLLDPGTHPPTFHRAVWRSLVRSGRWSGVVRMRRRSGERRPLWLRIDVIRDAQGRTRNFVGMISDLPNLGAVHEELQWLAFRDPLTGLPNRLLLRDRIERSIAYAQRRSTGFSLLFIDLDGFKAVNDRLGHAAGDCVLVDVARRLAAALRASDTVARLGGDEFIVLLDNAHAEGAVARVAAKLIAAVSRPPAEQDAPGLSASIGIARFPDDGRCADALICAADSAMYRAKAAGRGRFRFHRAPQPGGAAGAGPGAEPPAPPGAGGCRDFVWLPRRPDGTDAPGLRPAAPAPVRS